MRPVPLCAGGLSNCRASCVWLGRHAVGHVQPAKYKACVGVSDAQLTARDLLFGRPVVVLWLGGVDVGGS